MSQFSRTPARQLTPSQFLDNTGSMPLTPSVSSRSGNVNRISVREIEIYPGSDGKRWGINITAYCGRTIENIIVVGAVGGPSHGARGSPVGLPAARVSRVPRARGDFFALSFTRRAGCDRLRPAMVAPDRLSPATVFAHPLAQ